VRSGLAAARTILLFRIISVRPPKQPLFFSCSRGFGRRIHLGVEVTESSTNKQHHLSLASLSLSLSLSLSRSLSFSLSLSPTRSPLHWQVCFGAMVCVLLLQDLLQNCSRGGGRIVEDMCYERRRAGPGTREEPGTLTQGACFPWFC